MQGTQSPTRTIMKVVVSSVLIGATYFGLSNFSKSEYGEFIDLGKNSVEDVQSKSDAATEVYRQNIQDLISIRKHIDTLLPPARLERLIAEEVGSIPPSQINTMDVARIVKYAADNNVFTPDGNQYAANQFYKNCAVQRGGKR